MDDARLIKFPAPPHRTAGGVGIESKQDLLYTIDLKKRILKIVL